MIRLSKSCISEEEKKAVLTVLDSEFLGMGSEVKKFEEELKIFFNTNTLCVASGTAALQLALEACDIGLGDEVLVPSLTYLASFQSISACSAIPIPCDIKNLSLQIDLNDAQKKISTKTKAIMPVHYAGHAENLDKIYLFAKKNSLRVIEDAAHAFGSKFNNKIIGSESDIACFSFDGIKNITAGEGGCIVSKDKKVMNRIANSRLLGIENESEQRYQQKRQWNYDVKRQGWRYHMSNIMAAIGRTQLKRFPTLSSKRQTLAKKYDKLFKNINSIEVIDRDYNSIVPHIYPVRIVGLRDYLGLKNKLYEMGIETGKHYQPNHLLSFFKKRQLFKLPVTEKIFPELITLPLHPDLSIKEIQYVCNSLISHYPEYL